MLNGHDFMKLVFLDLKTTKCFTIFAFFINFLSICYINKFFLFSFDIILELYAFYLV